MPNESAEPATDTVKLEGILGEVKRFRSKIEESRNLAEEAKTFCDWLVKEREREVDARTSTVLEAVRSILDREPDAKLRQKFERLADALGRKDIPLDPVNLGLQLL